MVTQAVKYASVSLPLFLVWLAIVLEKMPGGWKVPEEYREMIVLLPFYLVTAFAFYSLASLGVGVAQFNDCPAAAESLRREIEEAKADLRKKGLKI